MNRINILQLFVLSGFFFIVSCQFSGKQDSAITDNVGDKDSIAIDTQMVKLLFPSGKDILTGGDGAISIPINEQKSLWLWGDSFLGEVMNNQRSTTSPFTMGNVWQILDGKSVKTIVGGTLKQPKALLETEKVDGHSTVLWPMHGFVKNNIIHVFMSTIVQTGKGTFDFYWYSTIYYRLRLSDLSVIDKRELLTNKQTNVHLGFGVLEYDGYYYIYGSDARKDFSATLNVARARLANDKLQNWQYFNGKDWSAHPEEIKPLQGIDLPVSEQFSVFRHKDEFVLLTQDRFKPEIYTFVANSPAGPWFGKKHIYTIPERSDSTVFTYNAMAHPQYGSGKKWLISYCVNAKNIPDLYKNASIYKPRFFWVPVSNVINN